MIPPAVSPGVRTSSSTRPSVSVSISRPSAIEVGTKGSIGLSGGTVGWGGLGWEVGTGAVYWAEASLEQELKARAASTETVQLVVFMGVGLAVLAALVLEGVHARHAQDLARAQQLLDSFRG